MITVKYWDSLWILFEEGANLATNVKEQIKVWSSMVLPKIAFDIFQLLFVDVSPTQVDCDVFVFVIFR
jgi:hypothetical protein